MDFLQDFLMFALPGGFLGSVVTWLASRRKRDNDFLADLQESIDLLSEKYTTALDENTLLKADNAKLLANQAVMEQKIDFLTRTVEELKNQLKSNVNGKQNKRRAPRAAVPKPSAGLVRTGKEGGGQFGGKRSTVNLKDNHAGRVLWNGYSGEQDECHAPGVGGLDGVPQGEGGDDTSGFGSDQDTDAEHCGSA